MTHFQYFERKIATLTHQGGSKNHWLIFLHGWMDNLESMRPLAEAFQDYSWCAFDLPGHGLSDPYPRSLPYHLLNTLPDMHALIQHLGAKEVTLIGHSLGAGISALYSGAFPTQVKHLVLIDALAPLVDTPEQAIDRIAQYADAEAKLQSKTPPAYTDLEPLIQKRHQIFPTQRPDLVRRIFERNMILQNGKWSWRLDPRIRITSLSRLSAERIFESVKRITCPALLIEGHAGYLKQFPQAEKVAQTFKNLKRVVHNGGHHIHLDATQAVAQSIRDFISP